MSLNLVISIPVDGVAVPKRMVLPRFSAGLTSRASVAIGDVIKFGDDVKVTVTDVIHTFVPTGSDKAPNSAMYGRITDARSPDAEAIVDDLKRYGFKDMA